MNGIEIKSLAQFIEAQFAERGYPEVTVRRDDDGLWNISDLPFGDGQLTFDSLKEFADYAARYGFVVRATLVV